MDDLRLKLKGWGWGSGWYKVELKFRWSWVGFLGGKSCLFRELGSGSKIVLGSTQIVKRLLFFIIPSILAFVSYLNLGSIWCFGALMGYFLDQKNVQKQLWVLFIKLNIFYFLCFLLYLIQILVHFGAKMGYFWVKVRLKKGFEVY